MSKTGAKSENKLMCGIAGMAGIADEPLLREMLAIIRHRGPNDTGTYVHRNNSPSECVGLGNNRLSIIDLSQAGHQPMCNEDGRVWVAYNGELYNFPDLREELVAEGHQFRSHTDTEVLVHLYEQCGTEMLKRLNGIFAFAIWDQSRRELLVARDRMGVKPLYYAQVGRRLYFASEIKALLACPELSVEIDPSALYQYLAYLYVPNPSSIFKGIFKLPPGHLIRWRDGITRIEPYWDLSYGNYYQNTEHELAVQLRDLLIKVTRRQLISDVPVGFFLSGGLDSSTLLACAAETGASSLNSYSIRYKEEHSRLEQSGDDAHFARIVAAHFGAEFHEIEVDSDVTNILPKVVWHLDDPIADPAAIATLLISEAASTNVKVLMSGQGADEVFAGYRVHRVHKGNALLGLLPRRVREELAPAWIKSLAKHSNKAIGVPPGLLLAFCRFADRILRTSGLERREQYAYLRSYLLDVDVRGLLSEEMSRATTGCSYRHTIFNHFERVAREDFINQLLYVDAKTFLADLNLAYSDKLSMACSVELRVPFLDNELVEFLGRIRPTLKIHGMTQKYLLRRAMRNVLPRGVLRRRKAGFGLPIRSWLRNELREMIRDMLSEERVRRRGLFEPAAVTRMIRDNQTGGRDYTLPLWGLLSLELWHEAFVDKRRATARQQAFVISRP